jgi:hypothetical protein
MTISSATPSRTAVVLQSAIYCGCIIKLTSPPSVFLFCLLGHPPCSVCVYRLTWHSHTLYLYSRFFVLFLPPPIAPPSRACTSPTAIMLPPSTVFTCEPRTRQFPVSVYFFCLPAPFFSLSSFEHFVVFLVLCAVV